MSTKGASNHYGNSRGGKQGKATNHIGYAWAKEGDVYVLQTPLDLAKTAAIKAHKDKDVPNNNMCLFFMFC